MDSLGNIKDYTSKNFVLLISVIGSALGLSSIKLSNYLEIFKYAVTLTDRNREVQYAIVIRMIKVLAIEIMLIFGYMENCMIYTKRISEIYIMIVCLCVTLIYYVVKSKKYK